MRTGHGASETGTPAYRVAMQTTFPLRYRDAQGENATLCHNDGHTLRVWLDGVEFAGSDFDLLDPVDPRGRAAGHAVGAVVGKGIIGIECLLSARTTFPRPLRAPSPRPWLGIAPVRRPAAWRRSSSG